jgi:hypothetical protein
MNQLWNTIYKQNDPNTEVYVSRTDRLAHRQEIYNTPIFLQSTTRYLKPRGF